MLLLPALQMTVSWQLKQVQHWLLHHLSCVPTTSGAPASSFRLLRLTGGAPCPALLDLLSCAWQPQLLLRFNPFLSEMAASRLHRGLLTWLQLCVLEDKLHRLLELLAGGPETTPALLQV